MSQRWLFGQFELRADERALYHAGALVPIGPRALDVLVALVAHHERVVSKAELLQLAWPGLIVEENNLAVQVLALRKVLGEAAIATVPRRGYRFTLAVSDPAHATAVVTVTEPRPPAERQEAWAVQSTWAILAVRAAEPEGAVALQAALARSGPAHGGLLLNERAAGCLLASFPSPRAAAACAFNLHLALAAAAATASAGIAAASSSANTSAARFANLAPPGETWASVEAAQELVDGLDARVAALPPESIGDAGAAGLFGEAGIYSLEPPGPPEGRWMPRAPAMLPTIAVIPLQSAGAVGEVGEGDVLADLIIAALSSSARIQVISRLSTAAYRSRGPSLSSIRTLLAAEFVLSGRCHLGNSRLTASIELADTRTSTVVWAQVFADQPGAIVQPNSDVVQSIAQGALRAIARTELQRFRCQPLPTLDTHTLLLGGVTLMYRLSALDFDRAKQALDEVARRAPGHAAPLAWLARWHLFRVVQGWTPDRDADGRAAMQFAQRALEIDPESSLALTMLGNVHTNYLRNLSEAERCYRQAIDLNPSESLAWLQRGNAASFRGEGETAINFIEKAVRLSPLDPAKHFYQSLLASAALSAGDYGRAISAAGSSLRLNNDHVSTHRVLAIALSLSGRLDEAREAVRSVLRLEPSLTVEKFMARSPGADRQQVQRFALALQSAGLPSAGGAVH